MKRSIVLCAIAALIPAHLPAEEPLVLDQGVSVQFHGQQGIPREVRVKVPPEQRIAGLERLHFTFRSGQSGVVRSPEIKLTVGETRFVIASTPFVVFEAPPQEKVYHLAHAPHPDHPHLVAFRLYLRGVDQKIRMALARTRFNPAPPGVSCRSVAMQSVGPDLSAMSFTIENLSDDPFTVTSTNFANLPEGFTIPPVTIPPAK